MLVYMCPFSSETARIPRATPAKVRGGRVGTPHPSPAYPSDAHLTPASGSPHCQHARAPRLKLLRRPSSNLPTAASEDTSPRAAAQQPSASGPPTAAREDPSPEATEAPLQRPPNSRKRGRPEQQRRPSGSATLGQWAPPQPHARTRRLKLQRHPSGSTTFGQQPPNSRTRGHLAHSYRGAPPAAQHYMTTQGHTATSSLPTRVQQAAPHQL